MNLKRATAARFQPPSVDRIALRYQERHDVWVAVVVLESQYFELGKEA